MDNPGEFRPIRLTQCVMWLPNSPARLGWFLLFVSNTACLKLGGVFKPTTKEKLG